MRTIPNIYLGLLIILLMLGSTKSLAQEKDSVVSKEEIIKKYDAITPKDKDFKFERLSGWSTNLLEGVRILAISPGENVENAKKIIDGIPATTWQSNNFDPRPEITLDVGKKVRFNKVVIFNRHTDARGTGGGNNAVKKLEILVSQGEIGEEFKSVGTFELSGPKEACFKIKGGGQVCFFIDNTEPNIIDLGETETRLIKLSFREAFWGEAALKEWKTSLAISEVMLFHGDNTFKN